MKTIECDYCNRVLPKDEVKMVGPSYTEANGEVHDVPVLAMCKDRDECESLTAKQQAKIAAEWAARPVAEDEAPF